MNDTTGVYRMNPAEDRLVYGDELTEGMWALPDNPEMRRPRGDDEDAWLRGSGSVASPACVTGRRAGACRRR